eukprot:SAG31_NODE_3940_length_3734_cov_1.934801_3_plen_141_part_00
MLLLLEQHGRRPVEKQQAAPQLKAPDSREPAASELERDELAADIEEGVVLLVLAQRVRVRRLLHHDRQPAASVDEANETPAVRQLASAGTVGQIPISQRGELCEVRGRPDLPAPAHALGLANKPSQQVDRCGKQTCGLTL